MKPQVMVMLLLALVVTGCASGMSPFEDRSHEVQIRHRVPSK